MNKPISKGTLDDIARAYKRMFREGMAQAVVCFLCGGNAILVYRASDGRILGVCEKHLERGFKAIRKISKQTNEEVDYIG